MAIRDDDPAATASADATNWFTAAAEYWVDAGQRTAIFLDVLRHRGNQYRSYMAGEAEPVLSYEFDVVVRGSELPRPINYGLVRIRPPAGTVVDPAKRPFVVIDPRAGHGPGIGGFKADSEIGVALQAGHPCYFIGFTPEPVPGQTIEDVAHGEAAFLERVIALHPDAQGKPAVIGNCQAGWAVMIVAALRPELFGPIIVAGAPLSFWAGVRGINPMRYNGGLLGGSWLTAMLGDLGGGRFDGAWLVSNFEALNPSNTLWTKQYNVWSKVDTESERYLGFERWWGGHVLLNAEEIQWIVDKLFVGNKLSTADIITSDGLRIDLRNVQSPIVCFCSHGDNITPPQQALGWISDLYASVDDIRAHGQTIVYCVHERIGHLGIFVSGSVARKEHEEFASNIDLIDVLPPGLYEAVIVARTPGDKADPAITGNYILRFEPRTIEDIRAFGSNDDADDRRFAAVARLSEMNLGLYRSYLQPLIRAGIAPRVAQQLTRLNPTRLPFELFSDVNPAMAPVGPLAEWARANRAPSSPGNPFLELQEQVSSVVIQSLDSWGRARDSWVEATFLQLFGSRFLQAMLGLQASDEPVRRSPGTEPEDRVFVQRELERLHARIAQGGAREAAIRAMLYVIPPARVSDERSFNTLRQIREEYGGTTSLADFKEMLREQVQMLRIDLDGALAAIRTMAQREPEQMERALSAVRRVAEATGPLDEEISARLDEISLLFSPVSGEPKVPTQTEERTDEGKVTRARRVPVARRPMRTGARSKTS
jgi:hypothetical protein